MPLCPSKQGLERVGARWVQLAEDRSLRLSTRCGGNIEEIARASPRSVIKKSKKKQKKKEKKKESETTVRTSSQSACLCVYAGTSNRKYLEALRRIPQAALSQGMPEHRQQLDAYLSPIVS